MHDKNCAAMRHCAISALLALTLVGCIKKPELKPFTPAECALTAQMPGVPARRTLDTAGPLGQFKAVVYESRFDDVTYTLMCAQLTDDQVKALRRTNQRAMHEKTVADVVARMRGTVLATGTPESNGRVREYGYSALIADGGDRQRTSVSFFVHGSVYAQLIATYPNPASYNQEHFANLFTELMTLN
ncbi:hypothetical protein GCM10025770_28540 [Viridibacterium curvum]|uniref:Uncharacterized protein n=2 Tax=Viridibacterium curvum TaxID=1101404 RepID=A0ABP9QVZ8_9RHOO